VGDLSLPTKGIISWIVWKGWSRHRLSIGYSTLLSTALDSLHRFARRRCIVEHGETSFVILVLEFGILILPQAATPVQRQRSVDLESLLLLR
jgi:hypothetical protein